MGWKFDYSKINFSPLTQHSIFRIRINRAHSFAIIMFKPSETANDLFRRLNNDVFELRLSQEKTEKLQFGSTIEVQAQSAEITEVQLFTFCCSTADG